MTGTRAAILIGAFCALGQFPGEALALTPAGLTQTGRNLDGHRAKFVHLTAMAAAHSLMLSRGQTSAATRLHKTIVASVAHLSRREQNKMGTLIRAVTKDAKSRRTTQSESAGWTPGDATRKALPFGVAAPLARELRDNSPSVARKETWAHVEGGIALLNGLLEQQTAPPHKKRARPGR